MIVICSYMIQELDRMPYELLEITGMHLITTAKYEFDSILTTRESNPKAYELSFNIFLNAISVIHFYVSEFIYNYVTTGGTDQERSGDLIDHVLSLHFPSIF